MITQVFLNEQIETLLNLEAIANERAEQAHEALLRAESESQLAEKEYIDLKNIRVELERQLAHFPGEKAEQAKQ